MLKIIFIGSKNIRKFPIITKIFMKGITIIFPIKKFKDISLKYNKKIKKHLHMNSKRYSLYIDSLDMIITNEDKINLIFRGGDKEKTFLFKGYRKLYL